MGERHNVDAIRALLERRLAELQRARRAAAEELRPVMLDQTSVGRLSRLDAMQVQAMAQATERRRSQEMDRIRATLARMDEGEFGYCVGCGEEIGPGASSSTRQPRPASSARPGLDDALIPAREPTDGRCP